MGPTIFGLPAILTVFALMVPESAGILIPSETTLLGAGMAAHQGVISPVAAVLAAGMGNLVGAFVAYQLGRRGLLRLSRVAAVPVVARSRALIERRGTVAVFWSRLLPLARTFVSFPAGAARVPVLPFALLTLVGSLLWAAPFVLLGDLAGDGARRVGGVVGWMLLGIGLIAVLVLLRPRSDR